MYSKKLRIETIQTRTANTFLPKIDDVFRRSSDIKVDLTRTFVDQVTFSDYPNIHSDGAAIIDTFLMNSRNIDTFKNSGTLGAIIEGFRNIDIKKEARSEMVHHLINSLDILTKKDLMIQQKLLMNPHSIPILIDLCLYCEGHLQALGFEILERLSKLSDGIPTLIKYDILNVLLTPEMLFRPSTLQVVRHGSCSMTHRITSQSPATFPVEKFSELLLDELGIRRVDGYMEIQLLHALLCHLSYLESVNKELPSVLSTLKHFINEITSETFENLEHMQQIVKCCAILSRYPKQALFMLDNSLGMALQFLVKTDFSLYRRKHNSEMSSPSKLKNKIAKIQQSSKRLSIQDTGERPKGTLLALAMIRPDVKINRNDDVNFIATRAVVVIFENIIQYRLETIADVVSSGLIPSLLFRVGKGHDRDLRFNKIVVHFIFEILHKIILSQPNPASYMSMTGGRQPSYQRFCLPSAEQAAPDLVVTFQNKINFSDIRGISNTLHAQGVTALLLANLQTSEDISAMQEALLCLSYMTFSVISPAVMNVNDVGKICHICNTRNECYFPSLSLITEVGIRMLLFFLCSAFLDLLCL